MSIRDLPQKTLEHLYSALEAVPTLNWKILLTRWCFRTVYKNLEDSEDIVAMIESNIRPAKALLDDLTFRGTTLQKLAEGLEAIGNDVAFLIVKEGAQKIGVNIQYSGRRPPLQFSTGNPQEQQDSSDISRIPCGEQVETLRKPVQESETTGNASHSSDPGLITCIFEMVISPFSHCFSFYDTKA